MGMVLNSSLGVVVPKKHPNFVPGTEYIPGTFPCIANPFVMWQETPVGSITIGADTYNITVTYESGDYLAKIYNGTTYTGALNIHTENGVIGFACTYGTETSINVYLLSQPNITVDEAESWYYEQSYVALPAPGIPYHARLLYTGSDSVLVDVREWDESPQADGDTTDDNFGGEFADLDPFDMTDVQSINDIIQELGWETQTGLDPYDPNGGCGFFTPYVLSQQQLYQLGNILFSSSMWNTISQWFSGLENPMDGFLRCLDFPCLLPAGGASNISICGQELYYSSTGGGTQYAQGHHLTTRYKDENLGSINLKEVWGSAVDYTDTQIQIFLPFVGLRDLDANLCVGRTLTLLLRIDCWTGDILYILHVDNDSIGGKWFRSATYCYRWTGNCASEIPIGRRDSSKGLSEILTGLAITAGGAISGNPAVAVGTALYGTATMMKGGLHKGIQSSGTLTGNSGAIDILYPYLIVQRAVPNYPNGWRNYEGATKGQTYKGSDLSGYTLFDLIHLEDMEGASEEEINELERVLTTEGIIL